MTPKQYDRQHLKHLAAMDRRIDQLFDETLKRLASYGIFLDKPLGEQPFSFSDYPEVQQIINGIFEEFRKSVEVVITKGLEWEDNLSASKATDIASRYGVAVAQQRSQAVAGFAQRKVGGLNLSERVWNITDTFHKEVETAMDIALRDGTPANRLATDIKQYLKHPDKLFRRVRDEHGQLQLSKRAKVFHPGAGVYRSSYKNARRLAVTETNMAYHKADNERWRQLDFVLGYEVQVSGTNPNICPLCMELAGKYPKEFEFVGWHPHCRCHAVPIMEDIDSFQARQEALLRGERIPATGQVTAPPKNFTDHLKDNSNRIARSSKAGTLPYFVRDNYKVGKNGTLTPTFNAPEKPALPSILERAKARHESRTKEQVNKIKEEAWTRELKMKTSLSEEERKAMVSHWLELEKSLGKKGRMMSIQEADKQSANPNFAKGKEFTINCQTCSPAYVLREWGFNVTAKGNTKGSLSEWISHCRSFEVWENLDGTKVAPVFQKDWLSSHGYKQMTEKRWAEYFEETCKEEGTYILTIGWKGGGGHATILKRTKEGLFYIEPQCYDEAVGAKRPISELCKDGGSVVRGSRGILRVDDKKFLEKFLSIFEKGS
jgi:hypothetical protein|nr:MAG TPA: minor capsid protein [Caudoviricetes sp.]